jgi:hypothetical protein
MFMPALLDRLACAPDGIPIGASDGRLRIAVSDPGRFFMRSGEQASVET